MLWLISGAWAFEVEVGAGDSLAEALNTEGVTQIVLREGYDPTVEDYGGNEWLFVYDAVEIRSEDDGDKQILPRLSIANGSGETVLKDVIVSSEENAGNIFMQGSGQLLVDNVDFKGFGGENTGLYVFRGEATVQSSNFTSYSSSPAIELQVSDGYGDVSLDVIDSAFDNMSSGSIKAHGQITRSSTATLSVAGTSFYSSKSSKGGSIHASYMDEVYLEGLEITQALATGSGAGVYVEGGPATLVDCAMSGSDASPGLARTRSRRTLSSTRHTTGPTATACPTSSRPRRASALAGDRAFRVARTSASISASGGAHTTGTASHRARTPASRQTPAPTAASRATQALKSP